MLIKYEASVVPQKKILYPKYCKKIQINKPEINKIILEKYNKTDSVLLLANGFNKNPVK